MSVLIPGGTLSECFERFMLTLDGMENADILLANNSTTGKRRADYLLDNRSVIIEQKILTVDPSERHQRFFNKLV